MNGGLRGSILSPGFPRRTLPRMTIDYYVTAHDSPPPSARKTGTEPPGRAMGTCAEVRDALSAVAPGIDWSDPTWGWLHHGDGTAQFLIGPEDPAMGIGVYVRFPGEWTDRILDDLRRAHPDWYIWDGILGECHHQL
jgi:hypothetical protein